MPIAPFVTALPHRLIVALALTLSMDVQALTLGRVQGAALIGRPLEVVVQVQLDPNQSITSACFEADVFHADTRQNPDAVRIRLEPTAATNGALLRITSSSRVDEPVVTIYVRAGCAQMSSRRYVLLADMVSEQAAVVSQAGSLPLLDGARLAESAVADAGAATAIAPLAGAQSGGRSDTSVRAAVSDQSGTASGSRRSERSASRRAAPPRPAATGRPAPKVAPTRRAATPPAAAVAVAAPLRIPGRSRLELDPLEVLSERVATLESSANAPVQRSERESRDVERLERLDASVKALLDLAKKNEASLLDVRNRLEKAQADRFSNTVIYALFGMLLLSLLAIAYLLARINRGPDTAGSRWFDGAAGSSDPDSLPPVSVTRSMPGALRDAQGTSGAAPAPVSVPAALSTAQQLPDRLPIEPTRPMAYAGKVTGVTASHGQVDVSLVEMSASTFDRLMQSGSSDAGASGARETVRMAPSRGAPGQATAPMLPRPRINADDLIDLRQRAEFLVTLGQTDQAVQVLEARIEQDAASCPQAFLDLFQLFHSLGLAADFTQLRDDFLRLFNARVPEFSDFHDEGRSLEDYPGAVDRLIRVWGQPTALDTLERLIYASPAAQSDQDAFDLAAFRDLLMLHAVAQAVRPFAIGGSGAVQPPLAAVGDGGQVDIDLTELFASEAAPTLILPQRGTDATAAAGSATSIPMDIPLDMDAPPEINTEPRSGNLIDFDLGEIDVVKKPDRAS